MTTADPAPAGLPSAREHRPHACVRHASRPSAAPRVSSSKAPSSSSPNPRAEAAPQPPIAEAPPLGRQLPQAVVQIRVAAARRAVAKDPRGYPYEAARRSWLSPFFLHRPACGYRSRTERQKFSKRLSQRVDLQLELTARPWRPSSMDAANSFSSLVFPYSSAFGRRASDTHAPMLRAPLEVCWLADATPPRWLLRAAPRLIFLSGADDIFLDDPRSLRVRLLRQGQANLRSGTFRPRRSRFNEPEQHKTAYRHHGWRNED